jgi:hypothetical protein
MGDKAMNTDISKPRWPQQQRFKFIREMLTEKGGINRAMLRSEFGISLQQATNDISKLARLEPNLLWYDKSAKRFRPVATPPPEELSADEFYAKMRDDVHAALCSNHLTSAVADFLAQLAARVEKLERHDL